MDLAESGHGSFTSLYALFGAGERSCVKTFNILINKSIK
jgi:hypothetical protein